jgi:uncharacterized protein
MKHFLLFYSFVPDYSERRAAYREMHLNLAWQAVEAGSLIMGGALAEPMDGGILLFRGETASVAEAFAASDPYVTNGLVTAWHVREWTTVVGRDASRPTTP